MDGTCNRAKAAILFDWENWWAVEDAMGPKPEMHYLDTVFGCYKAFWKLGIDVDLVRPDGNLSGYRLVAAPMLYMMREGDINRLKAYVREGGIYVGGYWSGIVNETDLCYLGENPLHDMLGVTAEEIDVLSPSHHNAVSWDGRQYDASDLNEICHIHGAKPLALYTDDYYKGLPALMKNQYGKGTAYYIAARMGEDFQTDFFTRLCQSQGFGNGVCDALPDGVTVSCREDEKGQRRCWFVQNFNAFPTELKLRRPFCDVFGKKQIAETLLLSAYGYAVLAENE